MLPVVVVVVGKHGSLSIERVDTACGMLELCGALPLSCGGGGEEAGGVGRMRRWWCDVR